MANAHHFELESRILQSLKRRQGVATASDVAADTGIGLGETEIALKQMLSLYKSHLDVDDSGNLLYRFDPTLTRRGEDPAHAWYQLKKQIAEVMRWIFKIWVMVMLIGYTIVFILILLALAVGAMTQGNNRDNDGLARIPLRMLGSLLEWVFWWNFFDTQSSHTTRRGYAAKHQQHKVDKPLYQKITDFVMGPELPKDPFKAQQRFTAWVRHNRGIVTPAEWALRTGQTLEQAENALTAGIMRFGGDVQVTAAGTLLYRFDELRLKAAEDALESASMDGRLPVVWQDPIKPPSLTGNPGSTNFWIAAFTIFNFVMASMVITTHASQQIPELTAGMALGLGWVPLIFSAWMLIIPTLRWIMALNARGKAHTQTQRNLALKDVFESVRGGEARAVRLHPAYEKQFALEYGGEPDVDATGQTIWLFETLAEQFAEASRARQQAHLNVVFGRTVFSSDEETKSMEEADLEDFERRLAFELGLPEVQTASSGVTR